MKRIVAILLTVSMFLMGSGLNAISEARTLENNFVQGLKGLNDPALIPYMEAAIYESLVNGLDSDSYFVENVSAVYISQEYLDEVAYNSKANIFFGYTLEELDKQFQGSRYVFTLGNDGTTIVEPFEDYDDTYDKVIKNIAVGTGVILVCVTVSVVSGGTGAAAISMIFAASAKTATIAALSGGALGAVSSGIVTGIQTQGFESAFKAAALAGSEGFKWGAISGALAGGVSQAVALKGATLNGLTMNEAAAIQRESGYPLDVIKQYKTMEQYNICKDAGLTPQMINGKMALVRNIDLNYIDELGRTNLQRMQQGLAALDPTDGMSYQIHHIGQKMESTYAILTKAEHMRGGNDKIWHVLGETSRINRSVFDKQRMEFWKNCANLSIEGVV